VLPGTPYYFESGGDPEFIPDLRWDQLKEFHRRCYSPGNCRVFLAGNIPTEKQLAFLNEKFFAFLPPGKALPPPPKAERWKESRSFHVPCPAGPGIKAAVFLSWLCGDTADSAETLALAALTETLLGHDGAPLTRALIDSGLGEDLAPSSGLEGEIRETVFSVGLRGVDIASDPEAGKKIETLVLGELGRLVKEGIPPGEIEAALLGMEFSHREIRRSGGPWSLVWLSRSLRGWLHGAKPWESLLFTPEFGPLKERLTSEPHYFESLIEKYLLANPHRAFVTIEPRESFLREKEAELAEKLARKNASFSEAERREIRDKAGKLLRIQEAGDSPQALAAIPHLSRKDLSPDIELVPREILDARGLPLLAHKLFTNGISYVDFAFPVDLFEREDYFWLPLFSRAIGSTGLPGMDYGEVSSLLARTAGGFHSVLQTGSRAPGTSRAEVFPQGVMDIRGRDWLIFRLKALDEKIAPSLDLALRLITEADFSDLRRIRDLAVEMKNDADSSLAPSGNFFASSRSGQGFSRSRKVREIWSGLEQIIFVHRIASMETVELAHKLEEIRDKLLKNGVLVNFTGGEDALASSLKEIGRRFGSFGLPKPRRSEVLETFTPAKSAEVFSSPSLQVGFAALSLPSAVYGSAEHAAELVLAHQLSTGALWETIRMKGGAYGAFASSDNLEGVFTFSTYRDPKPLRSLEAFSSIVRETANKDGDEESLVKTIIGSFAGETRPKANPDKGFSDFFRFLYGVEDRHRSRRLKALIALGQDEIAGVLSRLAASVEGKPPAVILAGKGTAEKAASKLGVEPQELPV
jgi:Zn-dependent M16 (insulinase) family peptidase